MFHSYDSLDNFNLYSYIDHALGKSGLNVNKRFGLWPSDASAVMNLEGGYKLLAGQCSRATFYRLKGVPETNPSGNYEHYVWEIGKQLEKMHIEQVKQAGLYFDNNVKFWIEELNMSGEIDLIVRHPDDPKKLVVTELKTSFGYASKKDVIGNTKQEGKPKPEHIMQIACYLYALRENPNIIGGKLLYLMRDDTAHTEFNITLEQVDSTYFINVNDKRLESFTLNDVFKRFEYVKKCFDENTLPNRDYSILYTDEEMEVAYTLGVITERAYKEFKNNPIKSNRHSDWRCTKCRWKEKCYSSDPF